MKNGVKSELAFAGSLLLISIIVLWDTARAIAPAINVSVSPKLFPFVVGIFLLSLSVLLIINILRGQIATPEGAIEGAPIEKSDFRAFLIVVVSVISFIVLINNAGFVIAASITFFGITLAFKVANKIQALATAVIFSLVVYESFTRFLSVDLPAGWLIFL
jgi:putative tricarboxylic transport membrane protein